MKEEKDLSMIPFSAYSIPGIKADPSIITADYVERVVTRLLGETPESIRALTSQQNKVLCRHIIYYLLKKRTKMSLKEIGTPYSQGHVTVLRGIRALKGYMSYDEELSKKVKRIEIQIW